MCFAALIALLSWCGVPAMLAAVVVFVGWVIYTSTSR